MKAKKFKKLVKSIVKELVKVKQGPRGFPGPTGMMGAPGPAGRDGERQVFFIDMGSDKEIHRADD